jgi:hypothetical protein
MRRAMKIPLQETTLTRAFTTAFCRIHSPEGLIGIEIVGGIGTNNFKNGGLDALL